MIMVILRKYVDNCRKQGKAEMNSQKLHSGLWFFLRSLLPSPISAAICLLLGFMLATFIVVASNLSEKASVSGNQVNSLAATYASHLVSPLEALWRNQAVAYVATALLWGLVGFLVYTLFEHVFAAYADWRKKDNYKLTSVGASEYAPQEKERFFRLVWRIGIVVGAFGLFLAVQPVLLQVVLAEGQFVPFVWSPSTIGSFLLQVITWAALFHGCVMALRLFFLRTRLFGDETSL